MAKGPKRALTVTIRITGYRELVRAFRNYPDDAIKELRAAGLSISGAVADKIRISARAQRQSALLAPTVKAVKDQNFPTIEAGGTRRVGRNSKPAYKVLFGSEFGSKTYKQFRLFDAEGFWFFITVKANGQFIEREYLEAVDEINRKWAL